MKTITKLVAAGALSATCLVLSACHHNPLLDDPKAKSDKLAICKQLRRQMIYNRHNMNTEASWQARSQSDRLKQLYKENNCDK